MRAVRSAALFLLFPLAVDAQRPQTRQGFGISFGVGSGSVGSTCNGCTSERDDGSSGYLRIGGHVKPNLFLAGELSTWVHREGGVDQTLGYWIATAQFYPVTASGFYVKGGLGLADLLATNGSTDVTSHAPAMSVGFGYDFRVGTNFSLTPFANYLRSMEGEIKVNGSETGFNSATNVVQLGLGFTWH